MQRNVINPLLAGLALLLLAAGPLPAADTPEKAGWEAGSAYNKLYDAREQDDFKGTVTKVFTVTPMPGMSPAVALEVEEGPDQVNLVHVCPAWFRDPEAIGVRRGDKVKVKGVWVEIDGKFVFLASKVKKGDFFEFKVRVTEDGTPFWTLSPEEQAKHSN
jgi:hypothetical protein